MSDLVRKLLGRVVVPPLKTSKGAQMQAEIRKATVVDLARFRAARERRGLPLFDDPASPRPLAAWSAAALSDRAIAHRTRMLRHLGQGRRNADPA